MKWTQQEYEQAVTRIESSRGRLRANSAGGAASRTKPEQAVRNEPVAAPKREKGNAIRVHVRVVSFRRKLCDPDNLCPKYFIDCLRSAGLIRDDSPEHITLEVAQERVKSKTSEHTLLELTL